MAFKGRTLYRVSGWIQSPVRELLAQHPGRTNNSPPIRLELIRLAVDVGQRHQNCLEGVGAEVAVNVRHV